MQESPSSSSLSSSSSNKSVSFSAKAKMRLAIHIKEYSVEEREATFYTSSDYSIFKQEARITVNLIENEQPISDDMGFCVRGIENMTRNGKASQFDRRKNALLSVLSTQERLHYEEEAAEGPLTPPADEQIAAAYANAVHESVASAHRTGLLDESNVHCSQQQQSSSKQSSKQNLLLSPATSCKSSSRSSAIRRIVGAPKIRINY